MNDAFVHPPLAAAPSDAILDLLDLVAAAMFVVDVAPDGSLRFGGLNKAHERLTGMRHADVVGRRPQDCLPPALAEAVTARYRACLDADGPVDYRERIEHPAGPRWWRTTLMPMREPETGRVVRLIGSALDISAEVEAERRLARQARLYQESFDRTPVMTMTLDRERLIVRVSNYLLQRLGYAREEMLGRLPGAFMTAASADRARGIVLPRAHDEGEVHDFPYTLLTRAGEEVDTLVSVAAIRDECGELVEYNAVALEVTELNRANQALAATVARVDAAQRLIQEIYDRTPAMLYTVGPDRRILRVSDYWLGAMGYAREEVIGRTSMELMTPESARIADEMVVPAFRASGQINNVPYEFVRSDGSVMDVLLSASMTRQDDGQELRSDAVMVDVTDRNRAFRELDAANREIAEREARERQRYIRTPAMLYTLGPDFRIVGVSDYWLRVMGYRREAVIGRLPFDFMTEAAVVRAREVVIPGMLEHDRVDEVPLELFRADGTLIEVLLSATGERGADGHFERIFSVMRDVTERNLAYRDLEGACLALEEKNRELVHFAHIASHDLREPLRKVRAFADRLRVKAGSSLGPAGLDDLRRIDSAVDRMRDLIRDLMALSLASSQEMRFAPVDPGPMVHRLVADMEDIVRQGGGTAAIEGRFCDIEADPSQIEQLFSNLIGNALKYRAKDRPLSVRIRADFDAQRLTVVVRDNGIGFEPDYAERIFMPFVRLHGRSAYEGTGMGLAICQKIVSRHNGRLIAEGWPGEGAAFTFELPRRQSTAVSQ